MRTSITPRVTQETEAFWAGCRSGELCAQGCDECNRLRFPPQPMCAACHSLLRSWRPIAGTGVISAFSIVTGEGTEPLLPGLTRFPYAVAVVLLDAGIRMVADFDADVLGSLAVGARVDVVFERVDDVIHLPRFVLAGRLESGRLAEVSPS